MGARLRYEIEVSPRCAATGSLPPLADAGRERHQAWAFAAARRRLLRVAAHRDGVWVALNVSDSGVGFRATSGRGLGLANLRARILGLYGGEASLRLTGARKAA
jgi:hypothetical protein